MEELEGLCKTLGLEVKECVLQQWRPTQGRLPIGSGKAEELRQQVKYDPEIGVVVFDQETLAEDPTKEAKLQVKLASQRYMLPRLRYYLTTGAGMEAQGGSVGAGGSASGGGAYLKGKGETQLQMDRSMGHVELGLPIISLVGYTNAGKSTLMNALAQSTEAEHSIIDRLFETLDPTRRSVTLPGGRTVMLADTVGFIQRLPEQLVAGFRATLEEVVETTMILHVVDVSSPTAAQQIASVLKTLKRLPKFKPDTPQIMVYNKVDKLEGGIAEELEQSKGPVKHEHHPVLDAVGQCSMDIESDRATVCLYGASADQVKNTICSQISKKMCTAREASTLWRLLPNKPFVLVHFNPM
eukprot:g16836.t1